MNFLGICFLFLSVTMVAVMSHVRKKYQIDHGDGIHTAASFLLYACLLSTAFGTLFTILFSEGKFVFGGLSLGLAVVYALCSTVTALIFIVATAWGNLSVLTIVAMLGSLVFPSLYGLLAFPDENQISVAKIVGFLLVFACMALVFRKDAEEKSNRKFILACIIAFFTQGMALVIFDTQCRYCPEVSYFFFVSIYMLFSAGIAFVVILLLTLRNPAERKKTFFTVRDQKTFFLISFYGVIFCVSEVLALNSVERLPLIIQAPLSFGFQILIVAAIDYLIYREKLSKIQVLQVLLAIATCVCFCV